MLGRNTHTHPDYEERELIWLFGIYQLALLHRKNKQYVGSYNLLMYISWLSVEEQFPVSEPEMKRWIK